MPTGKGAVVFAEDEATNRELIRALLTAGGYTPVAVRDGEACLRALSGVLPRAVLLDINMPGMDGLELLRTIRGSVHWSDIPVVIVSGRIDSDVVDAAQKYPKVFVIAKPVNPLDFIQRLDRCLTLSRRTTTVSR